jgi:uncharacterized protein (DUF1778 family)
MSVLSASAGLAPQRPKRERVEVRISHEQKALLQQAAALEGRTLSDFLVTSAQHVARETIREHQVISLSASESRRFAEALLSPPVPSDYMRAAVARYRQLVDHE